MFGLFEKKSLSLCKWCPTPNRLKGVPARLAAGSGPYPSLCETCSNKAFKCDPQLDAIRTRLEQQYAPRLEMLRIRIVAAKSVGNTELEKRIRTERDAVAAELRSKQPSLWTPEVERAQSDPDLVAELAAFAKRMREGSTVKSLKDVADEGQQEEWGLRKQSVAAFKAGDFSLGDALQVKADEVGKRVNEARKTLAGMTDDELFR